MGSCELFDINLLILLLQFMDLVKDASVSAAPAYHIVDWNYEGQKELEKALNRKPNINVAKNAILFVGDGNSLANTAAARIYKGQLAGKSGEETRFIYESFPSVGLSKTYNVDRQIPDSAGTATALLSGVKTKYLTVGVNQHVTLNNCSTQEGNEVFSLLHWSQAEGKSTGVVTNTRITHATPAASYAHTVNRKWESDAKMPPEAYGKCEDIASQLVTRNPDINVFFGGGRRNFLPNTTINSSDISSNGSRLDGRNLIEEWRLQKEEQKVRHKYVWNVEQLKAVDPSSTDYLLGLFSNDHMQYEALRCPNDTCKEPSLVEMTEKAIQILQKNPKGFFLLVESGLSDLAHHKNKAKKALTDTIQLDEAVRKALELTNEKETLIVVTADHAHAMSMTGYPKRGNSILGLENTEKTLDGLPFTTLMYANGPAYVKYDQPGGKRKNLSQVDIDNIEFQHPAAIPIKSSAHGGEDVAIYANGPMAHLFYGVHEQNYIAHVLAYASCVGKNKDHCKKPGSPKFCSLCLSSHAGQITGPTVVIIFTVTNVWIFRTFYKVIFG